MNNLIDMRRNFYSEKLVLMIMKMNSQNKVEKLTNLIKRWRFISFVNVLARKKLELMYKNLHVSYLEMADEVFNGEDIITPYQLQEFSKFGGTYQTWDLNDVNLMKEMGLDPEVATVSSCSKVTISEQSTVDEAKNKNKNITSPERIDVKNNNFNIKDVISTVHEETGTSSGSGSKKRRHKF